MHALDLRFQKLLLKQLGEEIADRTEQIADGSCPDITDYKHRCGYLSALRDVVGWTNDIKKSLDESG